MDIRAGTGIDFHRLILDEKRPLIIGGFEIPGELALEGHSDADLLLHALADAVLGALGLADIGHYFSDRDPANKNLDSSAIVSFAVREMHKKDFRLSNADITIIGEKPRISPHREDIKNSVASILEIDPSKISIKATTTEKMGALGRSEGLGCLATVLIFRYT